MTNLKVGVIGTGSMGAHHARIYSAMPGVTLAGISDKNTSLLESVSRKFKTPAFSDYRDLLAQGLNAVSIAVPTSRHTEVALAAVKSRCHVLLEKPIAMNSADAKKIIRAARRAGVKLMIGHTERFNPVVEAAKKALRDEKIISIDMTRVGPLPPRVKDTGVIIDLAIHDIDLLHFLTGSSSVEVHSLHKSVHGKHEDTAMILIRLSCGAMAHITTNWLTPFKARSFQIATGRRFIKVDLIGQTLSIHSRVAKNEDGGLIREMSPPYREPLRQELTAFIRCVRTGGPVPVSGEDGLRALQVAEACLAR